MHTENYQERKWIVYISNVLEQQHLTAANPLFLQVIRLRKKLSGAADAVKGLFGVGKGNDEVVEKLEKMQARLGSTAAHHRQHNSQCHNRVCVAWIFLCDNLFALLCYRTQRKVACSYSQSHVEHQQRTAFSAIHAGTIGRCRL